MPKEAGGLQRDPKNSAICRTEQGVSYVQYIIAHREKWRRFTRRGKQRQLCRAKSSEEPNVVVKRGTWEVCLDLECVDYVSFSCSFINFGYEYYLNVDPLFAIMV